MYSRKIYNAFQKELLKRMVWVFKGKSSRDTRLAQSVEQATLGLRVVSSSPILG